MDPAIELFTRLKKAASELAESAFAAAHPGWYLLSKLPLPKRDRLPFVTQRLDKAAAMAAARDSGPLTPELAETTRLWRIEKSADNAWPRRISLGRAPNNDIVIRHDSISKLHAHFHVEPGADATQAGSSPFQLTDVGSVNGSSVNGDLLADDEPTAVGKGDRLVFGTVSGRLLNAESLHAELRSLDFF